MLNRRLLAGTILVTLLLLLTTVTIAAAPVAAQAAPVEGSELVTADWLIFSYLVFFGTALAVFLIALKRGMFRNIEHAKYYMMTIREEDYYTPDWAKEDTNERERPDHGKHDRDR